MAVKAVDFVFACMKLMTKLDRLDRRGLARVQAENCYHYRQG
jgi:hypothetical protein